MMRHRGTVLCSAGVEEAMCFTLEPVWTGCRVRWVPSGGSGGWYGVSVVGAGQVLRLRELIGLVKSTEPGSGGRLAAQRAWTCLWPRRLRTGGVWGGVIVGAASECRAGSMGRWTWCRRGRV